MYQPHLFISVGETAAFFTLRETYMHEIWTRGEGGQPVCMLEERSFHLFNLAQDADEAFNKAMNYSRQQSMRLTTTREGLRTEMRDIKRRNAEQMEEAAQLERLATARRNLGHAQDRDAWLMESIMRNGGIHNFQFGKYCGESIRKVAELDRDYIEYLLANPSTEERYDNSLPTAQMEMALETVEPRPESQYFGEVGKRTNGIEATVLKIHRFYSQYTTHYGDSGERCVQTLVTDAGEILVLFTCTDLGKVGDRVRFNAMVKNHDEYRDVKQTTLNRPTKIEIFEEEAA